MTQPPIYPGFDEYGYMLGGLLAGMDFIYRPNKIKAKDIPAYVEHEFPDFLSEPSFFRQDRTYEKGQYPATPKHHKGVSGIADVLHQELRQYGRVMGNILDKERLPAPTRQAILDYEAAVIFYQKIIATYGTPKASSRAIAQFEKTFNSIIDTIQSELTELKEAPIRIRDHRFMLPNRSEVHGKEEPILLNRKLALSNPALVLFAVSRNARAMIDKCKEPQLSFKFLYKITGFETDVTDTMKALMAHVSRTAPEIDFPRFHENRVLSEVTSQAHQLRLLHDFLTIIGAPKQPALKSIETLLQTAGENLTMLFSDKSFEKFQNPQEAATLLYALRRSLLQEKIPVSILKTLERTEDILMAHKSLRATARII